MQRFFSARLHMMNVARFREYSMRARKKLLRSCSFLKETIFRRGLDAEPPVSAILLEYGEDCFMVAHNVGSGSLSMMKDPET